MKEFINILDNFFKNNSINPTEESIVNLGIEIASHIVVVSEERQLLSWEWLAYVLPNEKELLTPFIYGASQKMRDSDQLRQLLVGISQVSISEQIIKTQIEAFKNNADNEESKIILKSLKSTLKQVQEKADEYANAEIKYKPTITHGSHSFH